MRRFASAMATYEQAARKHSEADAAAWWDMMADWLGAQDPACEAVNGAALPLPYPFAIQFAVDRYASAWSAGPKTQVVAVHFAEALVRTHRIPEALAVLRQADPEAKSAGTRRILAEASFRTQDYAQAVEHLDAAIRKMDQSNAKTVFWRRRRANLLIQRGRAMHRAGIAGTESCTRQGIASWIEIAEDPKAASDTLGMAAADLLLAEPAPLRRRDRAEEFARRAVRITAGQFSPYMLTLACATGQPGDLAAAVQTAWEQGEIVKQLVPAPNRLEFEARMSRLHDRAGSARLVAK